MRFVHPGRTLGWLAVVLSVVSIPSPIAADWLVNQDGDRIETTGPWQVKRSLILFTRPNGTLASVRLSEIDLEASRQATAEAIRVTRGGPGSVDSPTQPTPRSVRVIDHRSVKAAVEVEDNASDAAPADDPPNAAPTVPPSPVEVVFWEELIPPSADGITIAGTLRNTSPQLVTDVRVEVSLFEAEGSEVGRARAFVGTTSLAAQSTTTFRALFPNVLGLVGQPQFEIRGQALDLSSGSTP